MPKPPELAPPYIVEMDTNCEECGGSGFDSGEIDPWGPEPCRVCRGAGTQRIVRNYLAEAFLIAANPENVRSVERQHLVAIIQHCREMVSGFASLPNVSQSDRGPSQQASATAVSRPHRRSMGRHSRATDWAARATRNKWIEDRKEGKRSVTFRKKWTPGRKRAAAGG